MPTLFANYLVGEPICCEGLAVFPLTCTTTSTADYRLFRQAVDEGTVSVTETCAEGHVPELLVQNQGEVRVLFLEGEELVGAKQNRILNTSVLVPAHSRLPVPVSCVERGRWRYSSDKFVSGDSYSPRTLRRALKASVSSSLRQQSGHRSDQGQVWREVASLQAEHQIESPTEAMADTFSHFQERLVALQQQLEYIPGVSGLIVAMGTKVLACDVFDKPATCRIMWERLLSTVIFDTLASPGNGDRASAEEVAKFLQLADALNWEPAPAVGEGQEYRAASPAGDQATALLLDGVLIHGSVVAAN
jgi:hypothetical protein